MEHPEHGGGISKTGCGSFQLPILKRRKEDEKVP
jgi:hypothetical protein